MSSARTRVGCLLIAAALMVACGRNIQSAANTAAPATSIKAIARNTATQATVPPTTVPRTTLSPTTVPPTTLTPTTLPSTTLSPTTVAETTLPATTEPATTLEPTTVPAPTPPRAPAPPVPVAAPADSGGQEPVIQLGTIEIPAIHVTESLFEGIRLTTLNRGPGHWPGTAMPGQVGNVVVAGHRVSHSKPFRNVDKLVPGDEVIFTTADGRFVYVVTSTEIVTPDTIRIIDQTAEKTATLFACHPPGSTRQRIVIHLVLGSSQA